MALIPSPLVPSQAIRNKSISASQKQRHSGRTEMEALSLSHAAAECTVHSFSEYAATWLAWLGIFHQQQAFSKCAKILSWAPSKIFLPHIATARISTTNRRWLFRSQTNNFKAFVWEAIATPLESLCFSPVPHNYLYWLTSTAFFLRSHLILKLIFHLSVVSGWEILWHNLPLQQTEPASILYQYKSFLTWEKTQSSHPLALKTYTLPEVWGLSSDLLENN